MEEIVQYIERHPEILEGRRRRSAYPRYYLCGLLRDQGLTCCRIGRLLRKNHSTVIHGTRMHEYFDQKRDPLYLEYTYHLRLLFGINQVDLCLEEDVLRCNSMRDLAKIKARLRDGLYKLQ